MIKFIQNIGKIGLLLILMLSSYAMLSIAFPYLLPPFPRDIDFLANKPQWLVELDYYMLAFYIHISCSVLVLAAGLTQFSKRLMFRYPVWHRNIGKLYIFIVLFLSAPSGLVMAFYGSGGAAAQWAFILQATGWWFFTFMAYLRIRQSKLREHGAYMLRSYAMTFSAISLRAGTYVVSYFKMSMGIRCPNEDWSLLCYPNFYVLEAWMSWMGNLFIVEILILAGILNYYFPKKQKL
jgi:hypothetical protein